MAGFQYSPLSILRREIRLIKLQPRAPETATAISCTVEHTSLDDEPTYCALSYTWRDAPDTQNIRLNGTDFKVTRNLYAALKQIQLEQDDLSLWVDAICINQEDNEEKSWQVGQMRSIYAKAAKVIIWLGIADEDSEFAMQAIADVGKEAFDCGTLGLRGRGGMDISKWAPIFIGKREMDNESPLERLFRTTTFADGKLGPFCIAAVDKFLNRPWTRRVWVMQELAVAQNPVFMCGDRLVLCNYFDAASMIYRIMCEIWAGSFTN